MNCKVIKLAVVAALLGIGLGAGARAETVSLEHAIEAERVEVLGREKVRAYPCIGCAPEVLELDPRVVITEGGRVVPFERLMRRDGLPATVIYSLATRRVVKVLW